MHKITIVILGAWLLVAGQAHAATKSRCPEKVLETATIEGIFQGIECGDFCSAAVKLDNGEIFTMFCDEELAGKSLGKTGAKVTVTYEVQQFWNEYANECTRSEVFKSGGPSQAARKEIPLQLGRYQQCTGDGTTAEQKCFDGTELNTTAMNPMELGKDGQGVYIGYRDDNTLFKYSKSGNNLTLSKNMQHIVPSLQIDTVRGRTILHSKNDAWVYVGEAQAKQTHSAQPSNNPSSSNIAQPSLQEAQQIMYEFGVSIGLSQVCKYPRKLTEEHGQRISQLITGHLNQEDRKEALKGVVLGVQVGAANKRPNKLQCNDAFNVLNKLLNAIQ